MARIEEKRWDKSFEKNICEKWKDEKAYKFTENENKELYSIDTPPPYVNSPIHLGHATTYTFMDMFARYHRMKGYNVLFPLGLDRNGLPIEVAAEKRFNKKLSDLSREEALTLCERVLEKSSMESVKSFLMLGISFNSWDQGSNIGDVYLTDSDEYRTITQSTFIDLWNKGLIYETEHVTNFSPGCRSTIADSEIEYKELASTFNDVKFKVKETNEEIIIGTTRPELIGSCAMVVFHPSDDRFKHLEGKTVITPLYGKEVPIKAHPAANPEKGTGLLMMCSFGDITDIRFFREQKLEPIIMITADGLMNEKAGFLNGLKVKNARKTIIEKLKENNLLVKSEPIMHRTPICERTKSPIEFISMPEFYLKQVEFKDEVRRMANEVNFFEDKSRQILLDWIDGISIDWPISRRRYYATEVPLWYCEKCNEPILPPKGKYVKPWKESCPVSSCPKCSGTKFRGENRVFDTWFDSSISPLYILGYERHSEFFSKHPKCSLRPQGKEIVRTWLYYTLLKDYLLTNKTIFKDAWINYHILDGKGIKMSKSLGNIINPQDIIAKYGAEPFRFWAAIEGNLTQTDFRCDYQRIDGARKTITKLWNVARFISGFEKPVEPVNLQPLDKWIINEVNELVSYSDEQYSKYDFHNPVVKIRHFLWETFASHYLELVKSRVYNSGEIFSVEEQKSAYYTLHYVLEAVLKLLAPVIPMSTALLYEKLVEKNIHVEKFPKASEKYDLSFTTDDIVSLNSSIWKEKRDAGKSLGSEIENIFISPKLEQIEKDLKSTHKAKNVGYGKL